MDIGNAKISVACIGKEVVAVHCCMWQEQKKDFWTSSSHSLLSDVKSPLTPSQGGRGHTVEQFLAKTMAVSSPPPSVRYLEVGPDGMCGGLL